MMLRRGQHDSSAEQHSYKSVGNIGVFPLMHGIFLVTSKKNTCGGAICAVIITYFEDDVKPFVKKTL